MSAHVKLLCHIEREDSGVEVESLWATREPNGYRIDSIPFFARGLAWGDVVAVSLDADGGMRFTELVAASGHSTVRVLLSSADDVNPVRDELRVMGCDSELCGVLLVAVDVPPNVSYASVRTYLEKGEADGKFEFEEGCLGQ